MISRFRDPAKVGSPLLTTGLWALAMVALGLGLGYLVTRLTLDLSLLAVAGAGLAVLITILLRPQWGFPLLSLGASFVTSVTLPIGNLGPGEVVVIVLLLVALLGIGARVYPLDFQPLYVPMGLYLLVGLLSLTYSPSLAAAVPKIVQWLNFVSVVLVVAALRPGVQIVRAAIGVFLLTEAALGCLAIATALDSGINQAGLYILDFHKNALGVYMAMALPILLARFLWPLDAITRRNTLLLLVPVSAGLLLSGSRGAWVGALVACVLLGFYRGRWVGLATLIGGGLLIVVGLQVLPESLTRADEIISIRGTVEGRYVVWAEAWDAYLEHPLFGVGIGSYVSNSHYLGDIGDYNVTDPHNILLRLLVELGPPGLLCFLAIWALIGWRGYHNNRRLRAPALQALNAGLIAALAAYVGAAMFGPAFQRGHGTLFFFFAALLYLLPRLDGAATQAQAPAGGRDDA